jgi:hypothetical protein
VADLVTVQYLVGELSVRLERLQAAADQAAARDIASLRYQVETGPVTWLAAISADLHLFGVCARLLEEE